MLGTLGCFNVPTKCTHASKVDCYIWLSTLILLFNVHICCALIVDSYNFQCDLLNCLEWQIHFFACHTTTSTSLLLVENFLFLISHATEWCSNFHSSIWHLKPSFRFGFVNCFWTNSRSFFKVLWNGHP
jgi:hypothetical protein